MTLKSFCIKIKKKTITIIFKKELYFQKHNQESHATNHLSPIELGICY